jgi:catechol 2,3-dioxygenase-like lactoylglutathione lyase family enzyme
MLRQVLLLQRDVPKATRFYQEGLGLRVKVLTERWAELEAGSTTLALTAVEGCVQFSRPLYAMEQFCYSPDGMSGPTDLHREAYCTTGYTPFLSFSVVDLQQTVSNMLQLGATLDGPIKYPGNGKVAAVRAPDGQMLSLYEADAT